MKNNCKKYRIKEFLYHGQVRYQPQKKGWLFWHAMEPSEGRYFFRMHQIPFCFLTLEGAQMHIQNAKVDEKRIEKRAAEVLEVKRKFGKPKYICCDE